MGILTPPQRAVIVGDPQAVTHAFNVIAWYTPIMKTLLPRISIE
jgi:hypothetical protein